MATRLRCSAAGVSGDVGAFVLKVDAIVLGASSLGRRHSRESPLCFHQRPQFLLGDFRRRDGVVGKRGEAAVGRQQEAFRSEQLDCCFRKAHDLVGGFHPVEFLIYRPNADAPILGQVPQHFQLARPRRAQLQEVIADLQLAQQRQERPIVAGQGHGFVAAPIAPADVNRRALAQSTATTWFSNEAAKANSSCVPVWHSRAAHEALASRFSEYDFGQHRFVELDHDGTQTR